MNCERCVNKKSEHLEDVSTRQLAASSSAVYNGEVFSKQSVAPGGSPSCIQPYKKLKSTDAGGSAHISSSDVSNLNECAARCSAEDSCAVFLSGVGSSWSSEDQKSKVSCHLRSRTNPQSSSKGNTDWKYLDSYVRTNQWVLIADVKSDTRANRTFWENVCANRGNIDKDDTMKIEMGATVDYFRPTASMDLCTFLTSPSTDKKFYWSHHEAGPYYGADDNFPYYADNDNHLGGASSNDYATWLTSKNIARQESPRFWGVLASDKPHPKHHGGCCGSGAEIWGKAFKMFVRRKFAIEPRIQIGTCSLQVCQQMCEQDSTCVGIQHNGDCELLVDPLCKFSSSFDGSNDGDWDVQSRAYFDPDRKRDASKLWLRCLLLCAGLYTFRVRVRPTVGGG